MSSKPPLKVTVLPAGHGDCILVQCSAFTILVDSGPIRPDIHARLRAALILALDGKAIDLAIITHHDEDHTGGMHWILRGGNDVAIVVNQLLFNSPSLIASFLDGDKEEAASFVHAHTVSGLLPPCSAEAVYAGQKPREFDEGRVVLTMFSPNPDLIEEYGREIACGVKQCKNLETEGDEEEPAGLKGRVVPVVGSLTNLRAMADSDNGSDRSKSNALSLAFMLSFEGRNLLFLGDSWASTVEAAFDQKWPGNARQQFDVVFVSHHGSKNNTTVNLYKRIDCKRFVICADGKSHPDALTLRRILEASGWIGPTFYLSENTPELRTMFAGSDFVRLPDIAPTKFDL